MNWTLQIGQLKQIENRETLFKLGKWGPPTMTLSNSEGENLITVWGQDRIWLIEETIKLMQVSNN